MAVTLRGTSHKPYRQSPIRLLSASLGHCSALPVLPLSLSLSLLSHFPRPATVGTSQSFQGVPASFLVFLSTWLIISLVTTEPVPYISFRHKTNQNIGVVVLIVWLTLVHLLCNNSVAYYTPSSIIFTFSLIVNLVRLLVCKADLPFQCHFSPLKSAAINLTETMLCTPVSPSDGCPWN